MVLQRVPVGLRGELTRWLLELSPGVFVGDVSALVRDKLWEMACREMKGGAGLLVQSADTEQGYALRYCGEPGRAVEDFDGLSLIRVA